MSRRTQTQSRKPAGCQRAKYHIINEIVTYLQIQRKTHNSLHCQPGEKPLGSDIDDVTHRVVIHSPLQQIIICIDFHADGTCAFFQFFFFFNFSPLFLVFAYSSRSQLLATRLRTRRQRSWKSKKIENIASQVCRFVVKIQREKIHLQYETEF